METNMYYKVAITELEPTTVAYIRRRIHMKDIGNLFQELVSHMESSGIRILGPSRAIYYSEEFNPEDTEVEVCFPAIEKKGVEGVSFRHMEGGTHAYTIHLGSYSGLSDAFAAVNRWIPENGYTIIRAPFENYLIACDMADNDESKLVTEVFFPVAKK